MTLFELLTQGDLALAGVVIVVFSAGILAGYPIGRATGRRRALAPEPPVYNIPTPPRAELYDQDNDLDLALGRALIAHDDARADLLPRVVTDDGEELSPGTGGGVLVIPRAVLTDRAQNVYARLDKADD